MSMEHEQAIKYRIMHTWFKTTQGARLAEAFSEELFIFKDVLRGQSLIQLGSCGDNPWLSSRSYRNQWILSPERAVNSIHLASSLHNLPFEKHSIDCVLAPLTLEAFNDQTKLLDEIDRVLKPMGYVILFGINPWSLWGLAMRFGYKAYFGHFPTVLRSSFSVKRNLLQRGYVQCSLRSFYYIPAVKHEIIIKKLEFLNQMGKMIWPYPPSFYCLIAQKYEHGLNYLIKDSLFSAASMDDCQPFVAIKNHPN